MITMNLTLDTRRAKKDGTYPIVFRIAYQRDYRDVATGFSVLKAYWNEKTNNPKETHPLFGVMTAELQAKRITYLIKILEYEKLYPYDLNCQKIKDFVLATPKKNVTVYSFWMREIELMYKAKRTGGAQIYKDALKCIHKIKNLEIPFEKLDYNFLKELEVEFVSSGIKTNTISLQLRTLRAIYNKAINSKVVSLEYYPFRVFRIKKEATKPRPISLEEIRAYFNLKIDKSSYLYDNWLLGKLMFMLIGINFKDLIMLSESDFRANRVFYFRAKSKSLYTIALLPEALEIINYFRLKQTYTLFGKLSKLDLENHEKITLIIQQRNKVFNSHLTKMGGLIGSSEKLTSYVFRYTWANIAKQLGYSKDLIAEALGHQYGSKVTGIYLEAYDKELVDEMNLRIYQEVTKR